jgi:hypothetical protein
MVSEQRLSICGALGANSGPIGRLADLRREGREA